MSLVNGQNGVVFGNRSIREKHHVDRTTKFVTDSTSWDSFSFTGFTVVYSQSANLAPVPALSLSSNDPPLSSTLASSPREDIFTYIRRLIPSPSPEATPARITTSFQVASQVASRKRPVVSPPAPKSSALPKKKATPSTSRSPPTHLRPSPLLVILSAEIRCMY